MLTYGERATLACIWDASAPKAGNVHPGAPFDDLASHDFYSAAIAIGPLLDEVIHQRVGAVILRAVRRSRAVTRSNANLGLILLLAPLVAAAYQGSLNPEGMSRLLESLRPEDCHDVYEAIRIAMAGGLGTVDENDVRNKPPDDLIGAMRQATERDSIARCYVTGFELIFTEVVPRLRKYFAEYGDWNEGLRWAQLDLLASIPDTLIARKCGQEVAERVSRDAARVLTIASSNDRLQAWRAFDRTLREQPHHRFNPGTTADLLVAGLFVIFSDPN